MLLDGDRGSFALSVDDDDSEQLLSWCWSSNLVYGARVRPKNRFVILHRWDSPETIRRFKVEDEHSARSLFEQLALSGKPRAASAAQRLIGVFRSLRKSLSPQVQADSIVRIFNAFLMGADAVRRQIISDGDWRRCQSIGELLSLLASKSMIDPNDDQAIDTPKSFFIQEFADVFLERDAATGCELDVNLLLRHASGFLYQEAHLELERRTHSQSLLFGIPDASHDRGHAKPDARFTAPSLARLLAEKALAVHFELRPSDNRQSVTVVDPACGSGIFLIEAWRELSILKVDQKCLVGYDQSNIAREMADFAIRHTVDKRTETSISIRDSLSEEPWETADIILMNPPFVAWNDMSGAEREAVDRILGDLSHDHTDKSLAFVHKAVDSLKPGAVLGCVIPAPLLESRAGFRWRQSIADEESLSLQLVGCFRGFNYFRGAIVEPAFLIIARLPDGHVRPSTVQVILANDGYEDRAIRQLRRDPLGSETDSQDWSVFQADQSEFTPASWLARSRESTERLRQLIDRGLPRVDELFRVKLGIRTGADKVFILPRTHLSRLGLQSEEFKWFRPVSTNKTLRSGRLLDTHVIFYPYDDQGKSALASEEAVAEALPGYYQKVLLPNRELLLNRRSRRERDWWELVEPRTTWQVDIPSKIVTTYFGQRGSFAFDDQARFAVAQGFGWLWKRGQFEAQELPWAYVAILNSRLFESLLSHFCPTVRGGQFDLSVRFVKHVPLPDLANGLVTSATIATLAEFGRTISTGEFPALNDLDRSTSIAYGLPFEEWITTEA